MKVHIEKEEKEVRKGLFKKVKEYRIYGWYELSDEEQSILDKNPDVLKKRLFDYTIPGIDDLEFGSPTVKTLVKKHKTVKDGSRFVSSTTQGLMEIENNIKAGAKKLKDHLEVLSGVDTNSSETFEI